MYKRQELERERKDSIVVEWGQRVNFPLIDDDLMYSQVLFLKGKSPVLVEDLKCLLLLYNFEMCFHVDRNVS